MHIYLMRHGSAANGKPGMDDSLRPLTPEGEEDVRRVARLAAAVMRPGAVWSSPYLRARQTAEIVMRELRIAEPLVTTGVLTPEAEPAEAWNEIRGQRHDGSLLLVGHQPLFSALAAYFMGFPDAAIGFDTATLGCIEIHGFNREPRGLLKWLLPARVAAPPAG